MPSTQLAIEAAVESIPSATYTATGNSAAATVPKGSSKLALFLDVTGWISGVKAEGTLTLDTNPIADDTFTVDEKVYTLKGPLVSAVASQGTLTLDTNPLDGDTFTVDEKVYTLEDELTDVDGNIHIGDDLAATKLNIVAAFDLSGTAGVDYADSMTAHPTVTIAAFIADDAVLTAVTPGVAGDSIATTETFDEVTNVFDAATLGTTTAGVDEVTVADVDGNIIIGEDLAATKLSIVAAFDLSGVAGVDYAASMTAHPTVDIAAFIADDAVLTAKTGGTAGNSIATTETFDEVTNIFDAATLGTTTAGTNDGTLDIDLQWSPDGGTTWYEDETVQELAQFTGIGRVSKKLDIMASMYRLQNTITGTNPELTYKVMNVGFPV